MSTSQFEQRMGGTGFFHVANHRRDCIFDVGVFGGGPGTVWPCSGEDPKRAWRSLVQFGGVTPQK